MVNLIQPEVLDLTWLVGPVGAIRATHRHARRPGAAGDHRGVRVARVPGADGRCSCSGHRDQVDPVGRTRRHAPRRRPFRRSSPRVATRHPRQAHRRWSRPSRSTGCGSSGSRAATVRGSDKCRHVAVELVKTGCSPGEALRFRPGRPSSRSRTTMPTAISEMEILDGDPRSLPRSRTSPPGLSGSFSITLRPGEYTLWCPGGTKNDGEGPAQRSPARRRRPGRAAPAAAAKLAAVADRTAPTSLEQSESARHDHDPRSRTPSSPAISPRRKPACTRRLGFSSRTSATRASSSSRSRRSPRRKTALNEYIEHNSSAIFAVPPGVEQGGYIGETLFDA